MGKDITLRPYFVPYWQGGARYEAHIDNASGSLLEVDLSSHAIYAKDIWSKLDSSKKLRQIDRSEFFGNDKPLNFEIGIGNGGFLIDIALKKPDENFIGVEVYRESFDKAVKQLEANGLENVRLIQFDADLILRLMKDNSLTNVYVNFPDPWYKKKHNKRRLLTVDFISLIASKLAPRGILHIATDHQDYAENIAINLSQVSMLSNLFDSAWDNNLDYFKTKYYKKFGDSGVYFFRYEKKA